MIKVHGYAAEQAKAPLGPYTFERRNPGKNDVVIDIQYCGVCHTDIHQVNDEWGGRSTYPMVPGHEITGIVTAVGTKVDRYKVDDRVGVGCFVDSCRNCAPCLEGMEQYCVEGPNLTYNGVEKDGKTRTQGGYSNKIVVDQNTYFRFLTTFLCIVQRRSSVLVSLCILLSCIGKQVPERKLV
jgi:alcohol dehydrogenase (NADP+)